MQSSQSKKSQPQSARRRQENLRQSMDQFPRNVPMRILVNTKYMGNCLRSARQRVPISRKSMAMVLGITDNEMLRMENGRMLIPRELLIEVFRAGILLYAMSWAREHEEAKAS